MIYAVPQVHDLHMPNVPLDVVLSWLPWATFPQTKDAKGFSQLMERLEERADTACWQEAISIGLVPRQG